MASDLSREARRVLEGLLAGKSLDELAPSGSGVRAEVEARLIAALEGAGKARRRAAADVDDPPELPADGRAVVWSDGASRGNPGPAAFGIRIVAGDGSELCREGRRIGRATNNVAEYRGVIAALEKAHELGLESLELRLDSELVVKQLSGEYRVKQPALQALKADVDRLIARFRSVRVRHVRRERNRVTDALANEALDGKS